jgi:hypothetical protein
VFLPARNIKVIVTALFVIRVQCSAIFITYTLPMTVKVPRIIFIEVERGEITSTSIPSSLPYFKQPDVCSQGWYVRVGGVEDEGESNGMVRVSSLWIDGGPASCRHSFGSFWGEGAVYDRDVDCCFFKDGSTFYNGSDAVA